MKLRYLLRVFHLQTNGLMSENYLTKFYITPLLLITDLKHYF